MTWKPSIKLVVAQYVFPKFNIEPHQVNNKTTHYSADFRGNHIEDTSLTELCRQIVEIFMQES